MEAADIILVNKFDGNLKSQAIQTKSDITSALKFIRSKAYWKPKV